MFVFSLDQPVPWARVFGDARPVEVEIGPGRGERVLAAAAANPAVNFFGIEARGGAAQAVNDRAARLGLRNVRVVAGDVRWIFRLIADGSVAAYHIHFPDPWPKTRHHKRRLVRPAFVHDAATALSDRGVWRLATDWAEYADAMRAALDDEPMLAGGVTDRWEERPLTRFERRGLEEGRVVTDLTYRRV